MLLQILSGVPWSSQFHSPPTYMCRHSLAPKPNSQLPPTSSRHPPSRSRRPPPTSVRPPATSRSKSRRPPHTSRSRVPGFGLQVTSCRPPAGAAVPGWPRAPREIHCHHHLQAPSAAVVDFKLNPPPSLLEGLLHRHAHRCCWEDQNAATSIPGRKKLLWHRRVCQINRKEAG